jgi:hypothetical protein
MGQGFAQHSMCEEKNCCYRPLHYSRLDMQRQCGDAAGKRAARAVFVCQVGRGGLVGLVCGHSGRWELEFWWWECVVASADC